MLSASNSAQKYFKAKSKLSSSINAVLFHCGIFLLISRGRDLNLDLLVPSSNFSAAQFGSFPDPSFPVAKGSIYKTTRTLIPLPQRSSCFPLTDDHILNHLKITAINHLDHSISSK